MELPAIDGNIIIREGDTVYHQHKNVGIEKDFTIFEFIDEVVKFKKGKDDKIFISVNAVEVII